MKFAYTILYVPDVEQAVAFYEQAFGFRRRFVDESGQYGELDTGDTTLAFAVNELAQSNLSIGFRENSPAQPPAGIEVAFMTNDVSAAFERAVAAGAVRLAEPAMKPWGQEVAYVRDLNGVLVEIGGHVS